ncbi:hypothetical protein DEU56DRAFT_904607 [Suillus clintonianus]|uniref:uncharacterized protein n=1 Tax=Suillus clintonianus TaxID=1904413 RepID=UPI001B86B08D|nr:uncharacterized protein DEU56DRAFT_904607 [Suillus clintonianus]KAG2121764.1 hypothetical protein DEU56DRAFT_904607 [Suillus clintonianus]
MAANRSSSKYNQGVSQDLVDSARTGKPVKLFASVEELKTYTLGKPGKIFPKENAYQGRLLKELLRELTGTYNGVRGTNGSAKKKNRKMKQKTPRAGGELNGEHVFSSEDWLEQ